VVAVEDRVNLVQLRLLTVVASREGVSVSELAQSTGLHVSRTSRGCDRLVAAGLLTRTDDPSDRRSVRFALTSAGRKVVTDVAEARRSALAPVLARMTPEERDGLVEALGSFAASAGQPADTDLWSVGWAT
jgi:DNA-binding MarR family transcriptional regulator